MDNWIHYDKFFTKEKELLPKDVAMCMMGMFYSRRHQGIIKYLYDHGKATMDELEKAIEFIGVCAMMTDMEYLANCIDVKREKDTLYYSLTKLAKAILDQIYEPLQNIRE